MAGIRVTWDETKNLSNQRDHEGISFAIASQVFVDPLQVWSKDRVKNGEQRWHTFGMVEGLLLVMVVSTVEEEFENGPVEHVHIISARKATRKEKRFYENQDG